MAETRAKSAPRAESILNEAGPTISVRDTARVFGVCAETVYEMIRRGDLDAMGIRVLHLGRAKRIATADLRRAVGQSESPVGAA